MSQFRTKTFVIDAVQVPLPTEKPQWLVAAIAEGRLWEVTDKSVRIKEGHDGSTTARHGDWVVKNPYGRLIVHSNETFMASYEPV